MWYRYAQKRQKHTGVMIAFMLPKKAQSALFLKSPDAIGLPIDCAEPRDEIHLTLCFLGQSGDLKGQKSEIMAAVEGYCAGLPPLRGTISGTGKFTGGEKDVLYASFDAPELPAFRQGLIEHLTARGISHSTQHGYTPHITLAYYDPAQHTPLFVSQPELGELSLAAVTVAWGGEQRHFSLRGNKGGQRTSGNVLSA